MQHRGRDRPRGEPADLPGAQATEQANLDRGCEGFSQGSQQELKLGLGALVVGVGLAGRRALRRKPELAPGACAALAVWGLHATIDWDWQLPAVTLPAIVLAGALIAASESPSATPAGSDA